MAVTVNVSPFGPKPQFVDWITGAVANGYQVFFYVAGSVNTKQATYTDSTGTVANTNPLVLDTAGQPNNVQIWFQQGLAYKVLIATPTDSDPPTNGFVLGDNLHGINDTSATAITSQWLAGPVPSFISGTQFSLSGDQTSNFSLGRRVQTTNAGGTIYGTISAVTFAAGITTVTIIADSGALDAGLSAVNFGIETFVNSADPYITPITDIQIITATGNWTKPVTFPNRSARVVEVIAVGGGGPGGGGRGGAAASDRGGGAGGGGGCTARGIFRASDLPATVACTIPTAATGGAGGANANGGVGAVGGNTTFGAFLTAFGGANGTGGLSGGTSNGGGGGGTGAAGAGIQGGAPQWDQAAGNARGASGGGGGNGSASASAGGFSEYGGAGGGGGASAAPLQGGGSIYAGGGGGGGGGVTAGNAQAGGQPGGASGTTASGSGGTGGAAAGNGGVGADGTGIVMGAGGGGGGGNSAATGGNGGNGGAPGGAGGGGGGGTTTGGNGGNGGRGEIRVYTYFA